MPKKRTKKINIEFISNSLHSIANDIIKDLSDFDTFSDEHREKTVNKTIELNKLFQTVLNFYEITPQTLNTLKALVAVDRKIEIIEETLVGTK